MGVAFSAAGPRLPWIPTVPLKKQGHDSNPSYISLNTAKQNTVILNGGCGLEFLHEQGNASSSLCPGDALLEEHLCLSVVLLNPLSPRRAGLCCHTVPPLGSMLFCSSAEVCFSPRA